MKLKIPKFVVWTVASVSFSGLALLGLLSCSGAATDIHKESELGDSVIGDDGSRKDGVNLGSIYMVTQLVEATSGIAGWANADMPFVTANYPVQALGSFTLNTQTPFQFTYTYPSNNFKLNEAHVVVDTARDSSDTEGIFLDGVFTGRLPANSPSNSTKITNRHYVCSGACTSGPAPSVPSNTFYMTWNLNHYKASTLPALIYKQTIDLNFVDLLTPTTVTPRDLVNDGIVNVVTGDDSPIYKALFFYQGFTISKTPLTCTNSASYTFENVYIHQDGNSIGQAAFTGTVRSPFVSWNNARVSPQSVEFYFDPTLPKVSSISTITMTEAKIALRVKRQATGYAALVINGVGVSESGFDRTTATSVVETWNDASATVAAWDSFLAGIPATDTDTSVTLDLITLLGAGTVRDLIAQGKFNIAFAGSIDTAYGQNNSSARTFGTQVAGPELTLKGTFYSEICQVPDNPDSPLTDDNPLPTGSLDTTSPVINSVGASQITSSSAVISWLTDEGADSQVVYGTSDPPATPTTLDATQSAFHSVTLTGLLPFKYYFYQVKSKDGNGNETIYATKVFRTLR